MQNICSNLYTQQLPTTLAESHVAEPACNINSPGALKCTYVNAGDISAAAKIRNWSQRSLFDSSILLSVCRDVTLKHWWWSPVFNKNWRRVEYYRCTAKRPKSEDGEQRSSGARVNGRGRGRGEGRRCLYRRLFAKYRPIWKLDHQLIILLFANMIIHPSVKRRLQIFTHMRCFQKHCTQLHQVMSGNLKYWTLWTYLMRYKNMNILLSFFGGRLADAHQAWVIFWERRTKKRSVKMKYGEDFVHEGVS